jgi:hypothetical protein
VRAVVAWPIIAVDRIIIHPQLHPNVETDTRVHYTPSACARNGVHYVDITGETAWILDMIKK